MARRRAVQVRDRSTADAWTGYELTQQVRRSLRFVWPSSEGHLYREQKRLIELGWATVEREPAGRRTRNRFSITEVGRAALAEWLATEPEEPHFQVEGVLRTFFGDHGTRDDLVASMQTTAELARSMLEEMLGFVDEYLADGGPLSMLEGQTGGGEAGHLEFHGRPVFPERLHVVALAIDVTTRLLKSLDDFFTESSNKVAGWTSTTDSLITPATRERLEQIRTRRTAH
ncbi:MAG: helix-turn-helix transcriptional regulator [Geodermatophilaceae bacterium]|nr:helix-turn-helix transcriptional regulator [Geodermatophilaceae bacterium]